VKAARAVLSLIASLTVLAGCNAREAPREAARPSAATVPAATPDFSQRPAGPLIVALGDSLTAGLGLRDASEAYPALLQERLNERGLNYHVVNAGVSGDTSAGGLSRLDLALDGDVRVLIVALGGNDGLRGLPAEELRKNLQAIIERAHERRIQVVLAGMEAPPNFGAQYVAEFRRTYSDLAKQYHAAFVPFLLQGVAGIESLNQRDGIHPTPEGARLVADNVWKALEPLVAEHVESK